MLWILNCISCVASVLFVYSPKIVNAAMIFHHQIYCINFGDILCCRKFYYSVTSVEKAIARPVLGQVC